MAASFTRCKRPYSVRSSKTGSEQHNEAKLVEGTNLGVIRQKYLSNKTKQHIHSRDVKQQTCPQICFLHIPLQT